VLTLTAHEAVQALEGRSSVDPNVIGGNSHYAMYFEGEKKWTSVSDGGGHVTMSEITDPARIAELNDAREVRLERQQKATQFHADDTFRTITRSPLTASVDDLPDPASPRPGWPISARAMPSTVCCSRSGRAWRFWMRRQGARMMKAASA